MASHGDNSSSSGRGGKGDKKGKKPATGFALGPQSPMAAASWRSGWEPTPPAAPAGASSTEPNDTAMLGTNDSTKPPATVEEITRGFESVQTTSDKPKVDDVGNDGMGIPNTDNLYSSDEEMDPPRPQDRERAKEDSKEEAEGKVADEVNREQLKPLRKGQQVYKASKLPGQAKEFLNNSQLYPPHTDAVHGVYRGQSQPTFEETNTKEGANIVKEMTNVMSVLDSKGNQIAALGAFSDESVTGGNKDSTKQNCLKVNYFCHSQVPHVKLTIDRAKGMQQKTADKVKVYITANNLMRRVGNTTGQRDASIVCKVIRDPKEMKDLQHPGARAEQDDDNAIWQTEVSVAASQAAAPYGATFMRPVMTGITEEEIVDLRRRAEQVVRETNKEFDHHALTPAEWMIWGLLKYNNFHFMRRWYRREAELQVADKFAKYFMGAMIDCATTGNWPHYVRQAAMQGTTISSPNFRIGQTVPPRDIVDKWRVTVNEKGEVSGVEAEHWKTFPTVGHYPMVVDRTFALRLAIERTREYQSAALQEQLDKNIGAIDANVTSLADRRPGAYYVTLHMDRVEGGLFGDKFIKRPAIDTQVKVIFTDDDLGKSGVEITGKVTDDLFGYNADLNVIGFSNRTDIKTASYKCSLELLSDGTAVDRQLAAVVELNNNGGRTDGVDLPHVLLGAPRSIDPKRTGSMAAEIAANPAALKAYRQIGRQFGFSSDQTKAAEMVVASQSGCATIHGPPGTGKTSSIAATMIAQIVAGRTNGLKRRRIIAMAPSNSAVDTLTRKVNEVSKQLGINIEMCRFKGNHVHKGPTRPPRKNAFVETEQQTTNDNGDDLTALYEVLDRATGKLSHDKDLQEFYFNNARARHIKNIVDMRGAGYSDKVYSEALAYTEKKRAVWKEKNLGERKKLREELKEMEAIWDERYMDTVDLLLCTNNSAAHETPMEYYEPDIAVLDECGLATYGDAITECAANKKSVKLVIATGDHKQQTAPEMSKGVNEAYKETVAPLFNYLMRPETTGEVMQLTMHYRMRSAFAPMVSKVCYENTLVAAPHLSVKTPLEVTLENAMEPLGKLWNGRLRAAIPVIGRNSHHVKEGEKGSICNHAEAEAIVRHVRWLSKLPAPPAKPGRSIGGCRILPKNVKVVSPYGEQVKLIRKLLGEAGLLTWGRDDEDPGRVQVCSSFDVQGNEGDIIISSWVRNTPGRPLDLGFTMGSRQLCVNFSRVKFAHFSFGSWLPWLQANLDNEDMFKGNSKGRDFAKVITDFREHGDVISQEAFQEIYAGRKPDEKTMDIKKAIRPAGTAKDYSYPRASTSALHASQGQFGVYKEEAAQEGKRRRLNPQDATMKDA
ncbi:uncharacterized protein LTR77_002555 [Saxophila tyrrhenica]|uniref:Uncharacterized protein n=1 Tax=Saxophila tyrrhenica TaxID=1690608 RepID=A0AAV9PJU7_9PEZI|nr:hypothetical protein LTR77_002555 [Saxophila tyrrhenica]